MRGGGIKCLIYVVGAFNLLNCLGKVFYSVISRDIKYTGTRCAILEKHPFIIYFIAILVLWIPHTITSYPASIEMDVWDSLYQYYGREAFTAHHPPVFTVLIGLVTDAGIALGDINIGFFLWALIQTIICAAIVAYLLYTMRELKTPNWLLILTFFIAVLSPFYTSYAITIVKDSLYSFAVLLYMIEIVYLFVKRESYLSSPRHIFLFTAAAMIMMLFRHNGKYILYAMTICFVIKCIVDRKKIKWKLATKALVFLLLPILLSNVILNVVINKYDVTVQEGESFRESLSLPFQQTARYALYYEDETPFEEKETIDKVIDYYALAGVYEPLISDPVKSRFHYYADTEDWINYFKVWLKQFIRHPMTYFGATMNQNYFLVYPFTENSRLYYSTYVDYFYDHEFMDELSDNQDMKFDEANNARISFYKLLHEFPITGVFSNIAVYNIVLCWLILFAIKNKNKKFLIITIPVIISDLVVIAGPAIYDNVRYALPIVYSMPLVLAYYIYSKQEGISLCTDT